MGVLAGNGWLAILYGTLGLSMGIAGIASVWAGAPLRAALPGWFLVGIASRSILEGSLFAWFVSIPIAAVLVAALILELLRHRSVASTVWASVGGGLAIYSLVALVYIAPNLPAICLPFPDPGRSAVLISYPYGDPPWDVPERNYQDYCFRTYR